MTATMDDTATALMAPSATFTEKELKDLTEKVLTFCEYFCASPMFPYQRRFARRIIRSLLNDDGDELSALMSRQSGKTQVLAVVLSGCMVLLPILAKTEEFEKTLTKFRRGLMVGCFAPVAEQAETLHGRIKDFLQSDHARQVMADPEIDEQTSGKGKIIMLRSGSLCRQQTANPRANIESKSYHVVVVDECFPAETPVLTTDGWVPIGEIVNGERRDWVVATQDTDGGLTWGNVIKTYRTPRHNALVRVDHEHGSVYATANHPFMVDGEAVPAIDLSEGAALSLVSGAPQPTGTEGRESRSGDMQPPVLVSAGGSSGADQRRSEPHEGQRDPQAHGGDSAANWAPPQGAGRQWSRDDRTTATALGELGQQLGRRACRTHWVSGEGRSSLALQDRPGTPRGEVGRRDRRVFPHVAEAAGAGSPEDRVAIRSRVVRVEVLEPGSPEFDQFSDGADFVYTLQVDSESHTYVAGGVLVGNCQDTDATVVDKSIRPMLAAYNGTICVTGTASRTKGVFYEIIKRNNRRDTDVKERNINHYQFDWRECAKSNPNYKKFVENERERLGEDSDDFQLSYELRWLLDRGMFITEQRFDHLCDPTMPLIESWWKSPIVVGVDPARVMDSTVVTAIWVDWENPDEFGYHHHRVLDWLEIIGEDWEEQYFKIVKFCSNYDVYGLGVDSGGVGDAVAQRLARLMPRTEVVPLTSSHQAQSKRWTHLRELSQRQMVSWPGHPTAQKQKRWKRFKTQMTDLELDFKGPYMLAAAPEEMNAHDDYADSLAIGCALTADLVMPEAQVSSNFLYG